MNLPTLNYVNKAVILNDKQSGDNKIKPQKQPCLATDDDNFCKTKITPADMYCSSLSVSRNAFPGNIDEKHPR